MIAPATAPDGVAAAVAGSVPGQANAAPGEAGAPAADKSLAPLLGGAALFPRQLAALRVALATTTPAAPAAPASQAVTDATAPSAVRVAPAAPGSNADIESVLTAALAPQSSPRVLAPAEAPAAPAIAAPAAARDGATTAVAATPAARALATLPDDVMRALYPGDTIPAVLAPVRANAAPAPAVAATPARKAAPTRAPATRDEDDPATVVAADAALLAVVLQNVPQQAANALPGAPAPDATLPMAAGAAAVAPATVSARQAPDANAAGVVAASAAMNTPANAAVAPPSTVAPAPADAHAGRRQPDAQPATRERAVADVGAAARDAAAAGSTAMAGATAAGAMDLAGALRAANSAASAAPVERSVAVPVHERRWPQALAAQLLVLSNDKVQAATLRLAPEHLGPLEVRIDLQDSKVNVAFSAAHPETRAVLEQAMPELRAALSGAGLTLGQATVQQQARQASQNHYAALPTAGGVAEPPELPPVPVRAIGLVDEYV